MRESSPLVIVVLAALAAAPVTLEAQANEHDFVAYAAMVASPIGTLPPILSSAMLGRPLTSPDVALRHGHLAIGEESANTFNARIGFPAGAKVTMGVNAGYETYTCSGCDGHFIGGVSAEGRLASSMLGTGSDAAQFNIGLNGEAGFGHQSDATAFSLNAGLPIALVSGSGTLRIAPWITPGFGWGRISGGGDSMSGTRFLLGGGITFQSLTNNLGVNLGFQKVFIDGGDTMFGVSFIFGLK